MPQQCSSSRDSQAVKGQLSCIACSLHTSTTNPVTLILVPNTLYSVVLVMAPAQWF